jgi:Outer membrane protein
MYKKQPNNSTIMKQLIVINKRTLGLIACAWLCVSIAGAQSRSLSLEEAISLARKQSVDASVALNELKTAYWEYRTYKANLLPEMNFSASLPDYRKAYSAYQQDDGSYTYVRNNYLNMQGELSIDQNIWLTGGKLSIATSLDFMKQLDGTKDRRYMSLPLAITLQQPVFGVNSIKWDRRIEPVRYQEAKAAFISATEDVTIKTIDYYFNLLLAGENVGIAEQNLRNAEKLYEVAKAKREMGQISKNDLLQMELNVLDARSSLTGYESARKSSMFRLQSFLGLEDNEQIVPVVPDTLQAIELSYGEVREKALRNNSFVHNIRRRQLEADYAVAKARGNLRQVTLFAQVGFTGTARDAGDAYRNLKDNQVVQLGVKVPLLDWGKRRGKVKVAQSNREVTLSRLKKETMEFNQNLFILVEQFNKQQEQLDIANRADEIARKRYDTNVETYMIGKISTLDLNDSQTTKDEARRKHLTEMFYYWYYLYQIRSLTLWDWHHNTGIDADFEKIVKE